MRPETSQPVLSWGDLIKPGTYRLFSRFSHAVNFQNGAQLITLVDATIGPGPLQIVVPDITIAGDTLVVRHYSATTGFTQLLLPPNLRYNSNLQIAAGTKPEELRQRLAVVNGTVRRFSSPFSLTYMLEDNPEALLNSRFNRLLSKQFSEASALIRKGELVQAARMIGGLGQGLTPSGDDFLAGLMIGLNVRQVAFGEDCRLAIEKIYAECRVHNPLPVAFLQCGRRARVNVKQKQLISELFHSEENAYTDCNSYNPLSGALFECARQGRVNARHKQLIAALFRSDDAEIESCCIEALHIGETSGADFIVGIIFGLESSLYPRS
jgi:hypothetical protein